MYISKRIKLNKKLAKKGVSDGLLYISKRIKLNKKISKERSGDESMRICVLKNEEIINEEIIFKWDREKIENLLEDVFEKVSR